MHDLDSSPLNGTCWPDWDLHILPRMPEVGDQRSNDFQTTNIGCKGTFTFQINGKLRIKQNQPSITRSPCDPRISSHSLDSSFQQIPWTTPRPARRWVFLMNTCTIEALENQGIQPLTIFEFVRSLIRSQWTCYTLRHTSRTLGKAINIYIYNQWNQQKKTVMSFKFTLPSNFQQSQTLPRHSPWVCSYESALGGDGTQP